MSLQQIIDTAVNVEVNRSKLVAQNISRSGRISTASRNWANPFRFTVTPKPVWTAAEYRSVFGALLDNDRYLPHGFYLNNVDATTFLADLGNSWMVNYQGGGDVSTNNNILDSYSASSQTSGAMICLTNINSTTITAGTYLAKTGDYLRLSATRYPYIATSDVVIPTAATAISGTIQPAGTSVFLEPAVAGVFPGNNLSFVSTTTRTSITCITSTAGLSVGQIITENGTNTGSFGGLTYIVANLFGFKAQQDSRLMCKMRSKTDYERSVLYYNILGDIARFNFISCLTNNYSNAGGMQEIANREAIEKEASLMLCKMYPEIYSINTKRKSKYTELKMNKNVAIGLFRYSSCTQNSASGL